ncbi:MAG: TFIIB-type zinc ribbon-containing protein [Bryobacteraceae bacterium]
MASPPPVQRYRCPGCSADMEFDPAAGSLKCPYCGTVQKISHPVNQGVEELGFEEYAHDPGASKLGSLSAQALEVGCTGCGSVIAFEPGTFAGVCPFCGAKIVTQPHSADPLIAPNGVLPFSVTRAQAAASVSQWLSSRWFAPSELKRMARPEGIHGVYVPFWTYDARTYTQFRGHRGDYYYETEMVTALVNGRQVTERRQVRKTRWSPAAGQVGNEFDDVLIPATRSINSKRLHDLDPWDLEVVCPYEPAYLSGFQAQRYQVPLTDGLGEAKNIMASTIQYTVRQAIGGDEQRVDQIRTEYEDVTFKHLLLPVWIGAYRLQGKVFQVIVNARTGEVQGERPYSAAKIALALLAALVVIAIIALLVDR